MKKILLLILTCSMLLASIGCKSNVQQYEKVNPNVQMRSSFNEEVYVWESFLFPTNRTTGAQ